MKEDLLFFGGLVVTILGAVFAIVAALYFAKGVQCEQQSVSFYNHDYGFFKGCMVQLDKEGELWVPLKNFRVEVNI